jgi:P-type conjugative transfer protein TrbJ
MDGKMGGRKMKTKALIALSFLGFSSLSLAGSVAGTGGSTEVTQLLNNAQLIEQTKKMAEQAQTLSNQLDKQSRMVDDMKRNGKALSRQEWGKTSEDLRKLAAIARQGEAIAYSSSNMDAIFRDKYKGYGEYANMQNGSSQNFSDQYAKWSQTNRDSIFGAMKVTNLQYEQFSTEEQTMKTIENLGKSAQGRMEAIQVGNLIASQQVSQIQKLRGLMMAQMQMQSSYLAYEANQKDSANAKSRNFFKNDLSGINVNDGKAY